MRFLYTHTHGKQEHSSQITANKLIKKSKVIQDVAMIFVWQRESERVMCIAWIAINSTESLCTIEDG